MTALAIASEAADDASPRRASPRALAKPESAMIREILTMLVSFDVTPDGRFLEADPIASRQSTPAAQSSSALP